ncbi:hypothetical protein AAY473_019293 [Plecturocebus cupreus]
MNSHKSRKERLSPRLERSCAMLAHCNLCLLAGQVKASHPDNSLHALLGGLLADSQSIIQEVDTSSVYFCPIELNWLERDAWIQSFALSPRLEGNDNRTASQSSLVLTKPAEQLVLHGLVCCPPDMQGCRREEVNARGWPLSKVAGACPSRWRRAEF